MIRMLVSRDLRRLHSLLWTFVLLPFLMLLLVGALQAVYDFNGDNAGQAKCWLISQVLPLCFGALLACQLVAGDKENGKLASLLALPIPPSLVWLTKFGLGWILLIGYAVYALVFGFACADGATLIGFDNEISFLSLGTLVAMTGIFAFTFAFLVSCLSPNALTALLVLIVCAGIFLPAGLGLLGQRSPFQDGVTGIWNIYLSPHHDWRVFTDYVLFAVNLLALPLAVLSCCYFTLYHRRFELRLIPYAVIFGPLFTLAIVPFLYLAFLAVYNHPALNTPVPRIATAWLHEGENRASYREFCRLLEEWDQQYGMQGAPDGETLADTAVLINTIHGDYLNDTTNRTSDTAARIIRLTDTARSNFTEFMATHSLSIYLETDSPPYMTQLPHIIGLIPLIKLESLALEQEIRRGNRAAALRRYARNLRWIGKLYRDNPLIMVLVADVCHGIMVDDLPVLFPLDRTGGTAAEADAMIAQLAELEAAARPALARGLEAEAAYMYSYMQEAGTSIKEGYPLLNRHRTVELYEESMLPFIAASRQPYHLARTFAQEEPSFAWHDYLLCPLAPVLISVATPHLNSTRDKHAITLEYGRLGQVHVQLWKYVRAQGRFPATLDELWQFAGVTPLTSELTGQPYPYTFPGRTARVDFGWARNVRGEQYGSSITDTSTIIR